MVCWFLSFAITFLPLSGASCFRKWEYIKSEACLLFNFSFGLYPGWWYSFLFFTVLNFAIFLLLLASYVKILCHVFQSEKSVRQLGFTSRRVNKRIYTTVKSVLLLVSCNLFLWMPVFAISILTLLQVHIPSSLSRYVYILLDIEERFGKCKYP